MKRVINNTKNKLQTPHNWSVILQYYENVTNELQIFY